MRILNAFLSNISNRRKLVIEDVSNIIRIIKFSPCKIVLGTEEVMFLDVIMDLIPFQIILALFRFDSKVFLMIFFFNLFSKGLIISFCVFVLQMKFCFFSGMLLFNEISQKFFLTDIKFCKPVVIHGLDRNFLYLLIFKRGVISLVMS